MKYIRNYGEYKKAERKLDYAISIISVVDSKLFESVFYSILGNVENETKREIESYIKHNLVINENFFDTLKDRFSKAAEISNILSDKAESVLNSIIQKAKDITSFVGKIVDGIRDLFKQTIEKSKIFFQEQMKNGNLKRQIEDLTKTKKEGLISDIKTIKNTVNFYRSEFLGKLTDTTKNKLSEFLSRNQQPMNESNVIATFVHGIERIPPFSWLADVQKAGEAGANKLISQISDLTVKLGGSAFQLPVIAVLIGVVFEQAVKNQVGGWLLTLVGTTNPIGMAISGMKIVAVFIAFIVSLDAILGERLLGHNHSEDGGGDH